jgi:serine/threonine protein kinase
MMHLLVLIAAAASLPAASASALRDRRTRGARGAERGAAADAVAEAARGSAVGTEKVCGVDVQLYGDDDFDLDIIGSLLGKGSFGKVLKIYMRTRIDKSAAVPVAVKVPIKAPTKDDVTKEQKELARMHAETSKEAALGHLVCRHEDAACAQGSPFAAFLGKYKSTEISQCSEKESGGCVVNEIARGADLEIVTMPRKDVSAIDKGHWNDFVATYSVVAKAGALRNLDAALAAARQLTMAVVRLQKLGITHHDIKADNVKISGSGLKLLDFGLACVTAADHLKTVEACPKIGCPTDSSRRGTRSYMSGPKVFNTLCKDACSAADLRSVDLFSVGATLLRILTGTNAEDMFPDRWKHTD